MSLSLLQEKIGIKADGVFGPITLKAAAQYFKLSPNRAIHFFAQTSHETGNFKWFTENLNYSEETLLKNKKYFNPSNVKSYVGHPDKIASRMYANRMGNGPEDSGDGWIFRGRGALQLTGKDNYIAFSKYVKDPAVVTNPDLVATKYAFESAMFFFIRNNLWAMCDKGTSDINIILISKRINGGTNGLADRGQKTRLYASWFK